MDIAVATYELTRHYPKDELFGLTSQSRRAAGSIAANIAEGYGRTSRSTYAHFLRISQGSLKELETQLVIAERLGYVPEARFVALDRLCWRTGRLLERLIAALRDSPPRSPPG